MGGDPIVIIPPGGFCGATCELTYGFNYHDCNDDFGPDGTDTVTCCPGY
jgi:hypothetical protein